MKRNRTEGLVAASVLFASAIILIAIGISYSILFTHAGKADAAGNTVVTFTAVGTTPWTVPAGVTSVTYLVVGGGGGGGGGQDGIGDGGGGGAGGFLTGTINTTPATSISVIVGGGGGGGGPGGGNAGNGGASQISGTGFTAVTASGGGGGSENTVGSTGGSGGGSGPGVGGGAGTAGQGNAGGAGNGSFPCFGGGGGGGAGGAGAAAPPGVGGNGGAALSSSITGASVAYAGGGGGGCSPNGVTGTASGGTGAGRGSTGTGFAASANTGSGGGGAGGGGAGGAGGSGIVIFSYVTPPGTPGTPTFSSVITNALTVNWTAATNATTYKVERCTGVGCSSFVQIASGVAATTYNDTGLTAGTSYSYRIRGTNSGGDGVYSGTGSVITLSNAPGAPTFTGVTPVAMTLNWSGSTGAASYKVERCSGVGCSAFANIASGVVATTYNDSGLTASTSYSYRLLATNASGDSAYSGTGTQPTGPLPGAPGTPAFSGITPVAMTVSWTAASNANSYKVERCAGVGCSVFSQITSGVVATSYSDSALTPGTSYTYRIRGTNVGGDGVYSGNGTQLTTSLPSTPGTPTFSSVTSVSITANWTPASNADSYKVERCTGAGCSTFTQIASGVTTSFYADSGLSQNTSYSYRVRGTNVGGDGAYSPSSAQTTLVSGATVPILGYLWSDTIGWIDANCQNTNTCGTYNFGLGINTADGTWSGMAWSDNVGWVSANSSDLTGCPTAPCTAAINGSSAVIGWLRVISGGASQSGGWDGFISLNGGSYGPTLSATKFSGYAWGDKNVGWVNFASSTTMYNSCTPATTYTCNGTQTLVQTITNASCQPTSVVQTTCVAPQFCSPGSPVCLTPPPTDIGGSGGLTGHLTAKPNLVPKNATTTVYWSLGNVSGCTVTANDGTSWAGAFSATSTCSTHYATGCTSLPITQQTVFTLSCTTLDSSTYKETATVNVLPNFQER